MVFASIAKKILTGLLLLLVISVVFSSFLGHPILIGYVETDSMVPTIERGDGFVVLPPSITGEISEGDTITFDAQHIEDGGVTTHRVIEITDEGYITRGDGNPFTDQEAGEPPVQDSQVEGVALQFGDNPVVLPYVGTVIETLERALSAFLGLFGIFGVDEGQIGTLTTAIGFVLIVFSLVIGFLSSEGRITKRKPRREGVMPSWVVLLALIAIISFPLLVGMVLPSGTDNVMIISAQTPDETNPTHIGVNQSETIEYEVSNDLFVPQLVVLEAGSTGVEFEDEVIGLRFGQTVDTTVTMSAPNETGAYVRARSEYHYIQVLPRGLILALHNIHPFVAMVAICLVISLPVAAVFALLVGIRPISVRPVHR